MVSWSKVSILQKCYVSRGSYLVNLRHQEQGHESCQDTQCAGNPERILALADRVGCVLLDDWDHIGAHESPDLAECGCVRVVLATNGSRAGLGSTETNVVTGPHLTESREDSVIDRLALHFGQKWSFVSDLPKYDNKGRHVLWGRKPLVASGHNESYDSLEAHSEGKGVAGTNPITHEGSKCGTGDVETVDHGGPAKAFPQRGMVA
jgi:hypothetical protein